MMHRALLGLAVVLAIGGVLALRRWGSPRRHRRSPSASAWIAAAFAAFLLRALAEVLRGRIPGSVDDFNRLGYAMEWARAPFFAQADHLWLTGPHAAIGALLWVVSDPVLALLAWSAAAWAVLVAGLVRLGRTAGMPDEWSCGGAILAACFPVAVPLLVSPLPDVMHAGLVLVVLAESIKLWRRESSPAAAVVAMALATALRFECWLLALVVVALGARQVLGSRKLSQLPLLALPFAFPLLWLASSASSLGHPLAFARPPLSPLFHHYAWSGELRLDPAAAVEFGGRVRDLLFAMKLFAWQALPLLPALAWLWHTERRAARLLSLVGAAWLLVAAVVTFSGGVAGHAPERLFLVAVAPLLVALGGAIVAGLQDGRGRAASALLAVGFVAHAAVLDMRHGGRLLEHMDASCIAAGERLRREFGDAPEFLEHLPPAERVHVWGTASRGTQGEFHAISALSGRPGRVRVLWQETPPLEALRGREINVALLADLDPADVEGLGFAILSRDGSWMLCARRGFLNGTARADLAVGGTPQEPTLLDTGAQIEWALAGPAEAMPWDDAKAWADGLVHGGHDDWRLPSRDELWLLRDTGSDNEPSLDARFPPGPATVWSGDLLPGDRAEGSDAAWAIDLSREWVAPRPETLPAGARAVRDAK